MVNVKGWVRTRRGSKQVNFVALNDGSTINNVQVVIDLAKFDEEVVKQITTGACLSVNGELVESIGSGQAGEIQACEIEVLGTCDNTYPLQKKGCSMEFLREIAHLRPRTNTFGAVFRIRHHMAIAIHEFFHQKGFFYFHTPIITASDCEGAGQMFQVTTKNLYDLKKDENGSLIYDDDFFGKQASLTVSGQLEGELAATALGAIYTFGPTFRAENSNTPRHLAEFWMVEPEVAFADLNELMDLEEEFIKYCVRWALEHCKDDLAKTVVLSVLGTYCSGMIVDRFIFGLNIKRRVCIISQEHTQTIINYLLHELHSGATLYESFGAYDGTSRTEIVTIVDKNEYRKLMEFVKKTDPKAFLTVYSVNEVRYQPKIKNK